jgi:hypothetical protein
MGSFGNAKSKASRDVLNLQHYEGWTVLGEAMYYVRFSETPRDAIIVRHGLVLGVMRQDWT